MPKPYAPPTDILFSNGFDGSKGHVHVATEMAQAHNVLIRGLNAIVQQAPHVPDSSSSSYKEQDVKDLLAYSSSWVKMVHHHHDVEEKYIFPEVDTITGQSGVMNEPKDQHELFQPGLDSLTTYTATVKPSDHKWEGHGGMKEIFDSFSKCLVDHLYAEVDFILSLEHIGDAMAKAFAKGEDVAQKVGSLDTLYDLFPVVLGCADKTYGGGNTFPPVPWVMPYLVKYWFAYGNGAWRFNPSDWWGQPRPLYWTGQPK
ncbi:hypothetical protein GMORB2_1791 [Geosmithia morbida]|uniref:Hemerythrin-like domain-containing protein n=1 Tax=Geosmithia morbida TaxID=1094350 RepID=A0A9P5D2X9_9HYPO|nr:uncharacterized protein GMORB2_1791 [Geosmithia morbida]KAF4121951.1 hypothetical protein GMORB2_1791 [Geosmithia morbida]